MHCGMSWRLCQFIRTLGFTEKKRLEANERQCMRKDDTSEAPSTTLLHS